MIDELATLLVKLTFMLSGTFLVICFSLIGLSFGLQKDFKLRNAFKALSFLLANVILGIMIIFWVLGNSVETITFVASLIGLCFAFIVIIWIKSSKVTINLKCHRTMLVIMSLSISLGILLSLYAFLFSYSGILGSSILIIAGLSVVAVSFYLFMCSHKPIFYEFLKLPTMGIILLSLVYLDIVAISLYFVNLLDDVYMVLSVVGYLFSLFVFLEFLISYYSAKKYYTQTQLKKQKG